MKLTGKNTPVQQAKLKGQSMKLVPSSDATVKVLNEYSGNFMKSLRASEEKSKSSTRKWGSKPLPGEPGWEKYFD